MTGKLQLLKHLTLSKIVLQLLFHNVVFPVGHTHDHAYIVSNLVSILNLCEGGLYIDDIFLTLD